MGRRRSGTVYEKDGRWWYALLLASGKRWAKPVPDKPGGGAITRAEAESYKDEALRRYVSGAWDPEAPPPPAPPPVPTFGALAGEWAKGLAHESAHIERSIAEHHLAKSDLAPLPVDRVGEEELSAFVRALRAKPSKMGGLLSSRFVHAVWRAVERVFALARRRKLVTHDPTADLPDGALPPIADKVLGARRRWRSDRDEVERLLSSVEIPPDRRVLYAILFLTGARRGEAVALRWSDWERARKPLGGLVVERAVRERTREETDPKTRTVREIPVHPTLAAALAAWKLGGWQRHYGRAPKDDDLIVPARTFRARAGTNVRKQLVADCDAIGLRFRRVHGSRHTFISMAIDDGARAEIIKKLTHPAAGRAAFDVYRTESWATYCAEVAKIRVELRPDELPLWKAAAGGGEGRDGGAPGGSATDSATGPRVAPAPRGESGPDDHAIRSVAHLR